MKKHLSTIVLVLVFFVGLSVLSYPLVSDWWNSRVQSRAIVDYERVLQDLDTAAYDAEWQAAQQYNDAVKQLAYPLMQYGEVPGYEQLLDVTGTGIMGYLTIPRIGVELPIYHGTSDAVLNVAVGHLEGTDLPTGGVGNHTVLSAHRGLPSAKLFSDLDKLEVGDIFTVKVLDRLLTYQVAQISIVLPEEVEQIGPIAGEDCCTLLTCTPYGINTHRLLVRGVRTENARPVVTVQPEAYALDSMLLAPLVAAPMLVVLLVVLLVKYRKKNK